MSAQKKARRQRAERAARFERARRAVGEVQAFDAAEATMRRWLMKVLGQHREDDGALFWLVSAVDAGRSLHVTMRSEDQQGPMNGRFSISVEVDR